MVNVSVIEDLDNLCPHPATAYLLGLGQTSRARVYIDQHVRLEKDWDAAISSNLKAVPSGDCLTAGRGPVVDVHWAVILLCTSRSDKRPRRVAGLFQMRPFVLDPRARNVCPV